MIEINEVFKILTLIFFLMFAVITDMNKQIIPNYITFSLMFIGVVYTSIFARSELIPNLIALIVMFFIGMLGLIGLGDIKLLMGINCLCGWRIMLIGLFFACLLCILYTLVTKPSEVIDATKSLIQATKTRNKMLITGEKKPFAPYIAFGVFTAYVVIAVLK